MAFLAPPTVTPTHVAFVRRVQAALGELEQLATPTNWWRSPTDNEQIARAKGLPVATASRHLVGLALDLVFPTAAFDAAAARRLRAAGLRVLIYTDPANRHVHVDLG